MKTLAESVWQAAQAQTIEAYIGPVFDPEDVPSVAKTLEAMDHDSKEVSPHALVKAERYASIGAAFILQTDRLVTNTGAQAVFTNPFTSYPEGKTDTWLTTEGELGDLARDIKYRYYYTARELGRDTESRYGLLLRLYSTYSMLDSAPTKMGNRNFARNGGGLPDAVMTFVDKIRPAVGRYLAEGDDKPDKLELYHQLAVLGIARATHHLAVTPDASDKWDRIDPDRITILRRGRAHTAVDEHGELLARVPQHPDPESTDPIELERPRFKCPAHAHIPSRHGSALSNAFHASVTEAAERDLL